MMSRVDYRLDADVAKERAIAVAALRTLLALTPFALAALVLIRIGYALAAWTYGLLAALAVVRAAFGVFEYRRVVRYLEVFHVRVDDEGIEVNTSDDRVIMANEALVQIEEAKGRWGTLAIAFRAAEGDEQLEQVEIPAGGATYAALRDALSAIRTIERKKRPTARWAIVAIVVLGVFFLPFVFEEARGRSPWFAFAMVLGLWICLRLLAARRR